MLNSIVGLYTDVIFDTTYIHRGCLSVNYKLKNSSDFNCMKLAFYYPDDVEIDLKYFSFMVLLKLHERLADKNNFTETIKKFNHDTFMTIQNNGNKDYFFDVSADYNTSRIMITVIERKK